MTAAFFGLLFVLYELYKLYKILIYDLDINDWNDACKLVCRLSFKK